MDIRLLSKIFFVRRLDLEDLDIIYDILNVGGVY